MVGQSKASLTNPVPDWPVPADPCLACPSAAETASWALGHQGQAPEEVALPVVASQCPVCLPHQHLWSSGPSSKPCPWLGGGLRPGWTLALAVAAARLLLLPGPPSPSSGKTLVTAGPIPTDGKPSGEDALDRRCGRGRDGAPWWRERHTAGARPGPEGWGPDTVRLGLRVWGLQESAGVSGVCVPGWSGPHRHTEKTLQPPRRGQSTAESNRDQGARPPGGLHPRGRRCRCLYHLSSFHYKVVLKSILRLIELQMQPKSPRC